MILLQKFRIVLFTKIQKVIKILSKEEEMVRPTQIQFLSVYDQFIWSTIIFKCSICSSHLFTF